MKRLIVLFCSLIAASCVSVPHGVVGSVHLTQEATNFMAESGASKLADLYPPAQNPITLKHPFNDSFGAALISVLRNKGYAITEKAVTHKNGKEAIAKTESQEVGGRSFSYLIDRLDTGILRLTMTIDRSTLSRAYVNSEKPYALGAWTVLE